MIMMVVSNYNDNNKKVMAKIIIGYQWPKSAKAIFPLTRVIANMERSLQRIFLIRSNLEDDHEI